MANLKINDINKNFGSTEVLKGINLDINDGDFKRGIHHGENLYENDGFIVHFFSKETVNYLLKGFENLLIDKFEEGNFPRKLYFVVNKKI